MQNAQVTQPIQDAAQGYDNQLDALSHFAQYQPTDKTRPGAALVDDFTKAVRLRPTDGGARFFEVGKDLSKAKQMWGGARDTYLKRVKNDNETVLTWSKSRAAMYPDGTRMNRWDLLAQIIKEGTGKGEAGALYQTLVKLEGAFERLNELFGLPNQA